MSAPHDDLASNALAQREADALGRRLNLVRADHGSHVAVAAGLSCALVAIGVVLDEVGPGALDDLLLLLQGGAVRRQDIVQVPGAWGVA